MCGISGVVTSDCKKLNKINAMVKSLEARGPDGVGLFVTENLRKNGRGFYAEKIGDLKFDLKDFKSDGGVEFAFGHNRLAIIDVDSRSQQPMHYDEGNYTILFNGEIFNYLELKTELLDKGYFFKTESDTEVIMALYKEFGIDFLHKMNGMWAIALYDRNADEILLARDRFGEKPLYYSMSEGSLYFSSQVKGIFAAEEGTREIHERDILSFINNGPNEYSETTIYHKIKRLKPGVYIKIAFTDEKICVSKPVKYYNFEVNRSAERFDNSKAQDYAKKYYEILKDSVRIRMRSDVSIGSALSGGLDSSSIVYLVNEINKELYEKSIQKTFSCVYKMGEDERECDESFFIDIVANELKIKNYKINPVADDVRKEHGELIVAMDEPPENSAMSGWHTYKLIKNNNVKVTLDGQGADEQLTGYLYYHAFYLANLSLLDAFKQFWKTINFPGTKPYAIRGLMFSLSRSIVGRKLTSYVVSKFFRRAVPSTLNDILRHDFETGLVNLLNNADHASMGHGVESRLPFMDYRLVEFLASVPSAYKMRDGWTKYLARLAFDKKLPDSIVWRIDKKGWPIPEDKWFSGPLGLWLKECVNSMANRSEMFSCWIAYQFPKDKRKMLRIMNVEREIMTHRLILIKSN